MEPYHDDEWGVPVRDDRLLWEHLTLDSFQAGLSWRTVLAKRENFRRAFEGFDPERVAAFAARDVDRLLRDPGIIRNRQKIEATIGNAQVFLRMRAAGESFGHFLWSFTGGSTLLRKPTRSWQDLPTRTPESDAMAAALKQRGFRFVGTTICYAFMQAVGMVDDHLIGCFRYRPRRPRRRPRSPDSS